MAVDETGLTYEHPFYHKLIETPGLGVAATTLDNLLAWGTKHSMWMFPMATSCCAIEFMTAYASRVDMDQKGAVARPTPRHCDVMVVAGTITVKMAPRVKKLWDQMPEPKWCIAMGSCAISGDFYRDIYSVVPGVDTIVPVDLYIPGCPPNADQLMAGLLRLQEKIELKRAGKYIERDERPERPKMIEPAIHRFTDPTGQRDPALSQAQADASRNLGLGGNEKRSSDDAWNRQGLVHKEES